jgi:hypothetical protein
MQAAPPFWQCSIIHSRVADNDIDSRRVSGSTQRIPPSTSSHSPPTDHHQLLNESYSPILSIALNRFYQYDIHQNSHQSQ